MAKSAVVLALSATLVLTLAAHVRAEEYAYPSKGQSTKQQQRDKQECQAWATTQTGVDPSKAAVAPREGASSGGGAAGGAALGAARGATEGAAGEGAARGAVRGRLLGAIRRRRQEREQEAGGAGGSGTREDYDRAYGACMTGRGYTVQ